MSQENLSSGFSTRPGTNRAVQPQKMARGLKLPIKKVEGLYYQCSQNKGPDQLCSYRLLTCVFVFAFAKSRFSHDEANYISTIITMLCYYFCMYEIILYSQRSRVLEDRCVGR